MTESIQVGFQAFIANKLEEFGAIRAISADHKWVTVYVENAGDFVVSIDAVTSVHSQKVSFDLNKLDKGLRHAIGHAHDAEQ